jgi:hypothetical protein
MKQLDEMESEAARYCNEEGIPLELYVRSHFD